MNAIQIEYFLGLFFAISSVSLASGRLTADAVKLIAGVVLIIMAIVHLGPAL